MELNENEIKTLEKLAELSSQTWFSVRTPNFIWDADNKVRMNVAKGCKELIECSMDSLSKLTIRQRGIVNELKKKIDTDIADCGS